MSVEYASVLEIAAGRCTESFVLRGAGPVERAAPMPTSHVRTSDPTAVKIRAGLVRAIRVCVRALYVYPVLLVPKLVLRVANVWYGDLITVAFVVLVSTFFFLLGLLVLLTVIVGPRSRRRVASKVVFSPPRASDVAGIVRDLAPKGAPRVSGRIDAGLDRGTPVLVEEWGHDDTRVVRLLDARPFVVRDAAGGATVVELLASPIVIASYDGASDGDRDGEAHAKVARAMRANVPPTNARCVLRQGDRVEVIAAETLPASSLEDAELARLLDRSEGSPYRGTDTDTALVRSTVAAPVILRLLST